MPRTTLDPPKLCVSEFRDGRPLWVFRIVRGDEPDDPVFLNALRSSYELDHPPRRVERSSTVIHMGLSVWRERGPAVDLIHRWPKLGDHIARLKLTHGHGFNWAQTGPPLHLTVWGDPVKLRRAVADISPVS